MKIKLIRHATCLISYHGTNFLLDPVLYDTEFFSMDIPHATEVDAILVTHLHSGHFDPKVLNIYGKDIPIICSNFFKPQLVALGCNKVLGIEETLSFKDINIHLTHSQHGTGEVLKKMGHSYGFVLTSHFEKSLYITGDTVWCNCIENVLTTFKPEYILAFAGCSTLDNVAVTLGKNDLLKMINMVPDAIIIPIHLETWEECTLKRSDLRSLSLDNLIILNDNDYVSLK